MLFDKIIKKERLINELRYIGIKMIISITKKGK